MVTTAFQRSFDEELAQLDSTARNIGKTIKRIGKFFVALLLYFVLNALLCVLFNYTKSVSTEIFQLIEKGLRAFLSNNLFPALEMIFELHSLPSIYAIVVWACMTMLSLFVVVANCQSKTSNGVVVNADNYRTQVVNTKARVGFYKQQVHFLS